MGNAYEVLPDLKNTEGEILSASYTANNGIRLEIQNDDLGDDWTVFDLTTAQALEVGKALVRWAEERAIDDLPIITKEEGMKMRLGRPTPIK